MLDNNNELKLLISYENFHRNANLMFNFRLHKYLNRIKFSTTNKRKFNNLIPTLTTENKMFTNFSGFELILFMFN